MTFGDGFWGWVEKKSKIQFYAVFVLVWTFLHTQTLTVLFFVSEDEIKSRFDLLKNEYIKGYLNVLVPNSWGLSDGVEYWLNVFLCLFVAGAVAFVSIWILPKRVLIHAYKKEREHENEKRIVDEKLEGEILKTRSKNTKLELDIASNQLVKAQKRADTKSNDKTVIWDEDYERFAKSSQINILDQLVDDVYENSGRWYGTGDELAVIDSLGLIELSRSGGTSFINLTEKGKYFIKKYKEV